MMNDKTIGTHLLLVVFLTGLLLQNCGSNDQSQCLEGQYLEKPTGNCNNTGTCTDKPEVCPDVWSPVCGCDGNTYGNACEAAAKGVNVSSDGECPVLCTSNADNSNPNVYCNKPDGDCDGGGVIADKPAACPEIWDPVCGCDGITYGNACEAAAAGVNVSKVGECPIVNPPCTSNADISNPGDYCQKPDGDCSGNGVIQKKPEACTMQYVPVCGCDGSTYGNACEAAAAGVNVLSQGACSP